MADTKILTLNFMSPEPMVKRKGGVGIERFEVANFHLHADTKNQQDVRLIAPEGNAVLVLDTLQGLTLAHEDNGYVVRNKNGDSLQLEGSFTAIRSKDPREPGEIRLWNDKGKPLLAKGLVAAGILDSLPRHLEITDCNTVPRAIHAGESTITVQVNKVQGYKIMAHENGTHELTCPNGKKVQLRGIARIEANGEAANSDSLRRLLPGKQVNLGSVVSMDQ